MNGKMEKLKFCQNLPFKHRNEKFNERSYSLTEIKIRMQVLRY